MKHTNTKTFTPPLDLVSLRSMHDSVIPFFAKKIEHAKRNERYKKAEHWTEEQRKNIYNQNRQPYSMALISHKINTILAAQRQQRTSFKVLATVDPQDEIKAELASLQLKEKEKNCDFSYIESEVFDAGLSVAFGAVEIDTIEDMGSEKVVLKKIDHRDIIWDKNSRDYLLKDALFMAKTKRLYRYQIEHDFGALPENTSESVSGFHAQPYSSYYIEKAGEKNSQYDIISVFTHYQKVKRPYYVVLFDDSENLFGFSNNIFAGKFRKKENAQKHLEELKKTYTETYNAAPEGEIIERFEDKLDKYVFTYNTILSYEETDLDDFPFCVYRSFHFEDDFWTLTDLLLDPQMFLDRIFTQIDYSFGRDVKNVFQGNINVLAEGETVESAKLKAEKTGGIIWTRTNEEVFKPIKMSGVNPQYFQVAAVMKSFLEDLAGGRSFQGLSEHNNESGRAIIAKQEQGALFASLFLDNLHRWKKNVGEKLLHWIGKYETGERTLRVLGGSLSPEMYQVLRQRGLLKPSLSEPGGGYITIDNPAEIAPGLDSQEFELIVTQVPLSENARQEKLRQLIEMNKAYPNAVPLEVMLEYFDMDWSLKQKVLSQYRQNQEALLKLEGEKLNIEKAKILTSVNASE